MSDAAPANPNPNPTPKPNPEAPRPLGPRTEAGKRRSRLNARIHGLTAKLPDAETEAAAMQRFADLWAFELGADTSSEEAIIRASAVAAARLERCRKVEAATMLDSAKSAVERWERTRRHRVRAQAQSLETDPANTVADLEGSSFGCEWLMRHWIKLDAKLAQGVTLEERDIKLAMRLHGYLPTLPGPDADPSAIQLFLLCRVAAGSRVQTASGQAAEIIPARAELRRLIAAEYDRLDALRAELWESLDGPAAEAVAQKGMVDTSKEGQLRHRYAREAHSELIKGISLVQRLRTERGRNDDRLWAEAHPHLRRGNPKDRPITEEHYPTCLRNRNPEPIPAPAPSPTPPPPDSRNEPSDAAPEAARDRLNPQSSNEIRREPPADAPPVDRRSEPRSTGLAPRPEAPIAHGIPLRDAPERPDDRPIRA